MKRTPIDDDQLVAILRSEEDGAVGFHDGQLAESQRVALDFYNGEPYGDEEDGRSQFVTRDVAEVVDFMTVAVLRAFVSGDRVVEFEGDEAAKEITAAIHHLFTRKQSGYRILHDWLKGGLMERIGVVKTTCETEEKVERQRGEGVTGEMLAQFMADKTVTITHAEVDGQDESGAETFTVAGERRTQVKTFKDYGVPVEEFLFAARTASEDTSDYVAHRCRKSRSELVAMEFDADVVADLPQDNGADFDTRASNRFADEGGIYQRGITSDPASQDVILLEEYIRIDRNGDGRAELLCVHRVGSVILEVAECDEQPFVVFTPFPMPHRMVGQSLADKVMDIQRLRSVATRQSLDAFYLANAPRTMVHEDSIGENTVDDLLTVRPGAIVRWVGQHRPEPYQQTFTADGALKMLEFATGERESRTGITRMNQGLDRDALNKTATGTAMMMQQGAQIEEYIARNFGESLARLFAKKLRLMAGRGEPFTINIDGKPVEVDPRQWPAHLDMNVQVGLGTGRKDARIAGRMQVVGLQQAAVQGQIPIVGPKELFNSAAGIIADLNLGSVSEYFIDPASPEAQQEAAQKAQAGPPPDPAAMKVQAEVQLAQQRAQADVQLQQQRAQSDLAAVQADMEFRREEAAFKLQLAREQAEQTAALANEKAAAEIELANRKADAEMELAARQQQMEYEIAMNAAANDREHKAALRDDQAALSKNRPGGDLSK